MDCLHLGPRHLIELPDGEGVFSDFWMCCSCGEVVGDYQKQNTAGCDFVPDKHHWVNKKGEIISEYLSL
jgi:hypothetical protein